jgi:Domain of unknown function (DUF4406)
VKVVYIAGPFRAPTHWGIVLNVRQAEVWALEVWKLGGVAICPHLNTANFQGALPDEAWLDGTLEMLRRCDAIFLIPGWEASAGARGEREEAERRGMAVLGTREALEAWIRSGSALRAVGPAEGRSELDGARERRDLAGGIELRGAPEGPGVGIDIRLGIPPRHR